MHLTVACGTRKLAFPEWRVGMWMTHLHSFLLFSFFLFGNKDDSISMVSASAWDKMGGHDRGKGQDVEKEKIYIPKSICAVNSEITVSSHCRSSSIFALTSAYLSIMLWTVAVTCYTERVYNQGWVLASILSLTMGRETALHTPSPASCPGHLRISLAVYTIPVYICTQKVTKIYKWGIKMGSLSVDFHPDFISIHLHGLESELAERAGTYQKKNELISSNWTFFSLRKETSMT